MEVSPANSSALDSTTPILCSSEIQRPTLRSYSEFRTPWRASLIFNTATPAQPNLSHSYTGSQSSGESTSCLPLSPTSSINRSTVLLSQLNLASRPWLLTQVKWLKNTPRSAYQASNWRVRLPVCSSIRLEPITSSHQRLRQFKHSAIN